MPLFSFPTRLILLSTILSVGSPAQTPAPLTITRPATNTYRLEWPAENLSRYQMQISPNLQTWMNLGAPVTGTGTPKFMQVTQPEGKMFYRLKEGAVRPGFNEDTIGGDDDNFSWALDLGFQINFFGQTWSQCYVNNNGNITFGNSFYDWKPFPLRGLNVPIIAPFWADVDTRKSTPATNPKLCKMVTFGHGTVDGKNAFGVNWGRRWLLRSR